MSRITKKYGKIAVLLTLLSILLNLAPLAIYVISALCGAALVAEKVALCGTVVIVAIMTAVAFMNKTAMKSRLWIILLGIYVCLDNILTPLIIVAVCQIVDEIIVAPLAAIFREKKRMSKVVDEHMED